MRRRKHRRGRERRSQHRMALRNAENEAAGSGVTTAAESHERTSSARANISYALYCSLPRFILSLFSALMLFVIACVRHNVMGMDTQEKAHSAPKAHSDPNPSGKKIAAFRSINNGAESNRRIRSAFTTAPSAQPSAQPSHRSNTVEGCLVEGCPKTTEPGPAAGRRSGLCC